MNTPRVPGTSPKPSLFSAGHVELGAPSLQSSCAGSAAPAPLSHPTSARGALGAQGWSRPWAGEHGWCRFVCGTRGPVLRRGKSSPVLCSPQSPSLPMTHFQAPALLTFQSAPRGHLSSWPCPTSVCGPRGVVLWLGAGCEGLSCLEVRVPHSVSPWHGCEPRRWLWVN